MADVQNQKRRWYSPQSLADRANDGFLGIIRTTGVAMRHVNRGTTSGLAKVSGHSKDEAGGQPTKASPPQPRPQTKTSKPLPVEPPTTEPARDIPVPAPLPWEIPSVRAPEVVVPAPKPVVATAPVAVAPAPRAPEVKPPAPKAPVATAPASEQQPSSFFKAFSLPFSALRSAFATASANAPSTPSAPKVAKAPKAPQADAAPVSPATTPAAPAQTAPLKPFQVSSVDSSPQVPQPQKAPAVSQPPPAAPASETKGAKPPVAAREPNALDVDAWLDSLSLTDRSQRVRLRSAYDDLVHGSALIRRTASAIFVTLGPPAESILVATARAATLEVTEACIEILIHIGSDEPAGLVRQLAESPDAAVRMVALRVSRCLESDQQKPVLMRALRDTSASIRRRALTHLAWSHPGWAPAEILRLCYDPDATVKWAALEALVAMDPKEARTRLDTLYPDMDPLLRRRAVRLLERQAQVATGPSNPTMAPIMSPATSDSPQEVDSGILLEEGSND